MHEIRNQLPQNSSSSIPERLLELRAADASPSRATRDLLGILSQFKPAVEKLVDEMGRWNHLYRPAADGILRSDCICYYASLAYGHILAKAGFDVRTVNVDLGGKFIYPINSHQYLIVNDHGEDTIVDPAYYQYLRILDVPPDAAPSEDILVVAKSLAPATVRAFAELRALNPSNTLKVKFYHRDEVYYQDVYWRPDEFLSYFGAIWDLSTARAKISEVGSFAGKLHDYRAGTLSRNFADPWVLDKLIESGLIEKTA